MGYLLDTHALLWFLEGDPLPQHVEQQIRDGSNDIYVSIASLWEIAIKINLGKLKFTMGFNSLRSSITKYHFEVLPITLEHLTILIDLPHIHRDPFDRIIISQSIGEDLPLITKDKVFVSYPVKTIW